MPRIQIVTDEAPPPLVALSQGIRVGDLLFVAGQGPFRADGSLVEGDIELQVRQTLENIDAIARAAGASIRDAVRVGVYLRDLADFDAYNEVYGTFFTDPLPARTTIQSDLVGFDVEIDAVIWLGDAT
jgi:reactive intermediate/imine deaminase